MGVAAILVQKPKQSNKPVISNTRCLDTCRYVVVQMSGLGLKVTGQLDIWHLQSTLDTSNFKGLGKICRVISSSR